MAEGRGSNLSERIWALARHSCRAHTVLEWQRVMGACREPVRQALEGLADAGLLERAPDCRPREEIFGRPEVMYRRA